jgi:CheY-like chemotaxis protein
MSAINANYQVKGSHMVGSHMVVESEPGPGRISHEPLSNLTIVVVEDHDDTRRSLGIFLGRSGANAVLARNAFEGIEAVKTSHPNLVLCDIKMPQEDGFEVLRKIRALGPDAGGTVPVIGMSALVAHAGARILDAGFNECLPKPFTPDKLVKKILTVVNG